MSVPSSWVEGINFIGLSYLEPSIPVSSPNIDFLPGMGTSMLFPEIYGSWLHHPPFVGWEGWICLGCSTWESLSLLWTDFHNMKFLLRTSTRFSFLRMICGLLHLSYLATHGFGLIFLPKSCNSGPLCSIHTGFRAMKGSWRSNFFQI